MLKVYLAGPYQQKDLINVRAAELRADGVEVTSRWLEEPEKPTIELADVTHARLRSYAVQDIDDIARADIFVLQPDDTESIKRQGRTVELGIAIGIALTRPFPIYVIGDKEPNIFHHLSQVTHFPNWYETKFALCQLAYDQGVDTL